MNSKVLYPALVVAWLVAAGFTTAPPADGDIGGSVADSATGTPLPGGEVRILRGGNTIAATTTDAFGRYVIHNVPAGSYSVEVRYLGYRSDTQSVSIGVADALARADFHLVSLPINLSAVEVTSAVPLAVDTRTGNQVFKQNDYHGAPTNTTSQILQQSIVGAARAPTGEVHIRGQHAEYTYYVDGVPVPAGISGSLNELFDPQVVNQIDFQTADHRDRGRSRDPAEGAGVGVREPRLEPCVWVRSDHWWILPRRAAVGNVRSRPRPASVGGRERRVCGPRPLPLRDRYLWKWTHERRGPRRDVRDRPLGLQQVDQSAIQFHSERERRVRVRGGRSGPSAPDLRRKRLRQTVPAEGRVLQRCVIRPATQRTAAHEHRSVRDHHGMPARRSR